MEHARHETFLPCIMPDTEKRLTLALCEAGYACRLPIKRPANVLYNAGPDWRSDAWHFFGWTGSGGQDVRNYGVKTLRELREAGIVADLTDEDIELVAAKRSRSRQSDAEWKDRIGRFDYLLSGIGRPIREWYETARIIVDEYPASPEQIGYLIWSSGDDIAVLDAIASSIGRPIARRCYAEFSQRLLAAFDLAEAGLSDIAMPLDTPLSARQSVIAEYATAYGKQSGLGPLGISVLRHGLETYRESVEANTLDSLFLRYGANGLVEYLTHNARPDIAGLLTSDTDTPDDSMLVRFAYLGTGAAVLSSWGNRGDTFDTVYGRRTGPASYGRYWELML